MVLRFCSKPVCKAPTLILLPLHTFPPGKNLKVASEDFAHVSRSFHCISKVLHLKRQHQTFNGVWKVWPVCVPNTFRFWIKSFNLFDWCVCVCLADLPLPSLICVCAYVCMRMWVRVSDPEWDWDQHLCADLTDVTNVNRAIQGMWQYKWLQVTLVATSGGQIWN